MGRSPKKKPRPEATPTNGDTPNKTHERWRQLFAQMPERQGLLYAAEKALELGGDEGIAALARLTGLSSAALCGAIAELESGAFAEKPAGRTGPSGFGDWYEYEAR